MNNRLKVAVVMGGPSVEYEISLRTGYEVIFHLNRDAYNIRAVVIGHDRELFYCDLGLRNLQKTDLSQPENRSDFNGPFHPYQSAEVWDGCDVAFMALHGSFGEDGIFQGYLDTLGIPYTGSGVFSSALAMNKIASKMIYIQHGIAVPPFSIWGKWYPETTIETIEKSHEFPCFVKCPQSGSSRLMGRADTKEELAALLNEYKDASSEILIECLIGGIEFSCGIIEDDNGLVALPPIEIRPVSARFFDYDAKYVDGATEEIVPAPHPASLLQRIQDTAHLAHRVLGCLGISRTDMIYADDTLYVLETNTLPGLTTNSLLPKAFKAHGGTYGGLLDILISTALKKKNGNHI